MKRTIVTMLTLIIMAVVVSAAEFTPSVENKLAPTVVSDDYGIVGTIVTPNKTTDYILTETIYLTSLSSKDITNDKDEFVQAYEKISKTPISELTEDFTKITDALGVEDEKKIVVKDLFEVTLSNKHVVYNSLITFTINVQLPKNGKCVVLHYVNDKWIVEENVKINAGGTITITSGSVGTFAILVTEQSPIRSIKIGGRQEAEAMSADYAETIESAPLSDEITWGTASVSAALALLVMFIL